MNFGLIFKQILESLKQNILICYTIALGNVSKNTVINTNFRLILIMVPKLLLLLCQRLLQLSGIISGLMNRSNIQKNTIISFLQSFIYANKSLLALLILILLIILKSIFKMLNFRLYFSNLLLYNYYIPFCQNYLNNNILYTLIN